MSKTPRERAGLGVWLRVGLVVALVVGATVAFTWSGVADRVTVGQVRGLREQAGPLAPVAYVAIYAVATVVAFPGLPMTLVGGILFGTLYGALLVTIGATLGALGAFVVARRFGRGSVERLVAGGAAERFDRALSGSGFSSVLFTRLVPVVPFNVVNYLWGLSGVTFRDYALATVIGMVPAELVYANIGGAVGRTLEGHDEATLSSIDYRAFLNRDVLLAFALLGALALIPTLVKLARRPAGGRSEPRAPATRSPERDSAGPRR